MMIQRKGRYRERRGRLESFDDLPDHAQEAFKTIKNVLGVDTYVFGSFFWGFWDELSDYDVFTDTPIPNRPEMIERLKNEFNLDVNIMAPTNIENKILIP